MALFFCCFFFLVASLFCFPPNPQTFPQHWAPEPSRSTRSRTKFGQVPRRFFSQKKHGKKHLTFGPFLLWGGKNMENCGRCNLFVIDEWWNFRRIWNFQLHRSFLLEIIVELRFCVSLHVWKYWMKCCSWTKQLLYVFSLLKTRSTFLTINAWATWVDQDWDHLAAWPWV